MFNTFKEYMMSVHGEKAHTALPSFPMPGPYETSHHDNMSMDHNFENRNPTVENGNMESGAGGGSKAGEKDKEKKSRPHVCDVCFKTFTLAGSLKTHMMTHTGTKPFVCGVCGKAFSLACNLKSHELIHTGEKPFVCDVCNKAFTQASHLKAHKRIHTGERPYKCPHCDADFNQSNHVQKHIRTVHSGNSQYVCDVAFPTFIDLERHKSLPERNTHLSADSRQRHAQSSDPENPDLVNTGLPLPAVRPDLTQSRSEESSPQVTGYYEDGGDFSDDCGREYEEDLQHGLNPLSERHPLSAATGTSSQAVVQPAEDCGSEDLGQVKQNMETSREELLQSLIRRKQSNYTTLQVPKDDEIIYCEECDRESLGDCPEHNHFQTLRKSLSSASTVSPSQPSSQDGRSPHKESANTCGPLLSTERSHLCQRCPAAFVMFNSLKLHMMFIHGEKLQPVLPVSPGPEDSDDDDLDHINTQELGHLGDENNMDVELDTAEDKRFVKKRKSGDSGDKSPEKKTNRQMCDICFKSFTYLKTHKLTHSGYKQFKCSLCSKAFSLACNLKAHELTHTGQKPFVCDICNKAFTQGSHLKAHKRIHTGERPYKCPHCDADFNQSNHVQKHIRTVHSGDRHFVCEICGGAFSRSADLEKHKKVHSGGKKTSREKKVGRSGRLKKQRRSHAEEEHDCAVALLSMDEEES